MKTFLKIILAAYIAGCVVLFAIQENFVFNPEKLPESYEFRTGTELDIPLKDGKQMNMLYIEDISGDKAKGAIMYLHGNRGSIRYGIYQIRHMRDLGYDIFIPDYRSYGKTEGPIHSEQQLYQDVQEAYDYLSQNYEEGKIILVGYSLGTAMASYLASMNDPGRLVLIAPFTSITDIKNKFLWFVPDFLVKYKFPVKKFLADVDCPVTIVHGMEDRIVDFEFSEELNRSYSDKVELVAAPQESHRSIIFADLLQTTLYSMLVK